MLWMSASFLRPSKPFFSHGSMILPIRIAYSICSAITTKSEKLCAELPTKYSKYGALKVLENKPIISFSNRGGLTCASVSRHLVHTPLQIPYDPFSNECKLDLSEAMSILNLYCLIKASTRSFHPFTLVFSNRIYQVRATLLKLSWKKWTNNF
jgi:hypothetical protein